jgi:hypothetical protein
LKVIKYNFSYPVWSILTDNGKLVRISDKVLFKNAEFMVREYIRAEANIAEGTKPISHKVLFEFQTADDLLQEFAEELI